MISPRCPAHYSITLPSITQIFILAVEPLIIISVSHSLYINPVSCNYLLGQLGSHLNLGSSIFHRLERGRIAAGIRLDGGNLRVGAGPDQRIGHRILRAFVVPIGNQRISIPGYESFLIDISSVIPYPKLYPIVTAAQTILTQIRLAGRKKGRHERL